MDDIRPSNPRVDQVVGLANKLLRRGRHELVPLRRLNQLTRFYEAFALQPTTVSESSPELEAYLSKNRSRLDQLRRDYAAEGHAASGWSDERIDAMIDFRTFRGDNMFVFQGRGTPRFSYLETARYVREVDTLGLADRLTEDGSYGAQVVDVGGWSVSRDLLDSILEISFLDETIGLGTIDGATVLDIGAGYGRLAHRLTAAMPNVSRYICTDGVAESTFIQEFYVEACNISVGEVVPLPAVQNLGPDDGITLAVNVHSFAEMPLATSRWWIDQIARCEVPHVFLATDYNAKTTGLDPDGRRHGDFTEGLRSNGYKLVADRPKYTEGRIDPELQLYPAHYWLFSR